MTIYVGDVFELNGRLGCVYYLQGEIALVKIQDTLQVFAISRAMAQTLVQAFQSDPGFVEMRHVAVQES